MWWRIGTRVEGTDIEGYSLGKQSRRKNIIQPFVIFYSLVQGYTHLLWSRADLLYSLVSVLPQADVLKMAQELMRTEIRVCVRSPVEAQSG